MEKEYIYLVIKVISWETENPIIAFYNKENAEKYITKNMTENVDYVEEIEILK